MATIQTINQWSEGVSCLSIGPEQKWKPSTIGNDLWLQIKEGIDRVVSVSDDAGNTWVRMADSPGVYRASNAFSAKFIYVNFSGRSKVEVEAAETTRISISSEGSADKLSPEHLK